MQKKSNFVKINKTLAAICTLVVLIPSIFAADLLYSKEIQGEEAKNSTVSSMYKQLEAYAPAEKNEADGVQKMNNRKIENANIVQTFPNAYDTYGVFTGEIDVLDADTGKVSHMALDDYVVCALAAEMPQSFEMQALMAQAVAIRTYAVRSAFGASKHGNADVCSDYRCCQSMIAEDDIDFDISKAACAVKMTEGIIAVYDGAPILAAYHSSSFGTTKSSEEVWGGALDYLVPVSAPEDKTASAHTVIIDKQKVKSAFEKNGLNGDFVFETDANGICINASDKNTVLSANKICRILGLRSDAFTVSQDGESYVFVSYGYGHGVGMSQYGAQELAKSGFSFYEILKYYYTGISFGFVN